MVRTPINQVRRPINQGLIKDLINWLKVNLSLDLINWSPDHRTPSCDTAQDPLYNHANTHTSKLIHLILQYYSIDQCMYNMCTNALNVLRECAGHHYQ